MHRCWWWFECVENPDHVTVNHWGCRIMHLCQMHFSISAFKVGILNDIISFFNFFFFFFFFALFYVLIPPTQPNIALWKISIYFLFNFLLALFLGLKVLGGVNLFVCVHFMHYSVCVHLCFYPFLLHFSVCFGFFVCFCVFDAFFLFLENTS